MTLAEVPNNLMRDAVPEGHGSPAAELRRVSEDLVRRLTEAAQGMEGVIYLDDHATTQPAPEVVHAVHRALTSFWANPSSTHRLGQVARQRVELSREAVARLINARPAEVVFTSGGTEALKLAIYGVMRRRPSAAAIAEGSAPAITGRASDAERPIIITSPVEHTAVRALVEELEKQGDAEVLRLEIDGDGVVSVDHLRQLLKAHAGRVRLVSVQWANNETGAIQPLTELIAAAKDLSPRTLFHTDATQWVGKMPTDVRALPVDLLTCAAHKFHGPKGVGALYVRTGVRLAPQMIGGSQERNRRGGTENVPGIVGLGVAAALAQLHLHAAMMSGGSAPGVDGAVDAGSGAGASSGPSFPEHPFERLRRHFEERLVREVPGCSINAATARCGRIWSVSNVAFERLEAEAVLMTLSERGVCASGGSACSSGSLEPSPVLLAMKVPEIRAHGSVRFSFHHQMTQDELDTAVDRIVPAIRLLQETLPVRRA